MLGTRTILGLAIDEFGIVAAEVSARSGRPEIRHVGQLAFDDKLSSENINERAGQLKAFLRSNRFSSKQVVIGIPLKWVVAREMIAPAANAEAVAGMLGIQAERAFSLNASELIFDYYGSTSPTGSSKIMLLAARRQMVDQIKELAVGAGLHPQAVTISALAFSAARSTSDSPQHYGLYARPTYCEFWSQSNGRLQTIRHVPIASSNGSTPDPAELLSSAIQRQVVLSPQQDQAPPYQLTLYDASGLSSAVIDRLNKQLKPDITLSDGRSSFLSGASAMDHSAEAQSIAAAAVAMTVAGATGPAVDFLNPRIGAKQASGQKKAITWGVIGAAAVVLIVAAVGLDWHFKQAAITDYEAQLETLKPQINVAQEVVDRVSFAKPWISQSPEVLECLKQLTLVFPQMPNSIWATNLDLNEKGGGSMSGKAVTRDQARRLINSIADNAAFTGVKENYIRLVGSGKGSSSEGWEFSVQFQFKGNEKSKIKDKGGK